MSDITTGNSQNHQANVLEDNKIVSNLCKPLKQISKTVSNANFSSRKLWNDASRASRNSIHLATNNVIEEESEVISVLTKQLCLAESQMRKMQSIMAKAEEGLRNKDHEIIRLKRKVKDWENKHKSQELLRKKEQQTQANNSEYFYQRCLTLEHKICEMEKFLADYDLVWVGDTKALTNADNISKNYINTYYDQLIANIDQLNLTARKGEVYVHRNEKGGGATFKTSTCMALKFYKNGMTVQDGSLRSYNDPATSAFIRDILDGYFPSELQQEYPDGVPFMIEDHRTELYVADSAGFPGQGYRLGKQSPVDNSLSTNARNNISQRSNYVDPLSKDNVCDSQNIPLLSLPTNRFSKSKESLEVSSVNLPSLRSHILASHNNVCSDSHIQSHINAELVRRSRRRKGELSTKKIECGISSREHLSKSRDVSRSLSNSRTRCHSSTDRSSTKFSSNISKSIGNRLRPRPRSASLSGRIVSMQSLQTKALSTAEINKTGELNIAKLIVESSMTKCPRVTKSATYARSSPPLLHQINEATRKPGELRLKIRSLTGSTVYLVHVSIDESVTKLYELLDKAMKASGYKGYKVLLSGYSPKKLERVDATLKECGINRDCVLHLVND
ncbi:uncharacterized protein LOC116851571 isoform X2 [Odontomachus brunneus]|nr:uncharacterized protein LOC116851571 isoform X2 [Odontomachus brunneus]